MATSTKPSASDSPGVLYASFLKVKWKGTEHSFENACMMRSSSRIAPEKMKGSQTMIS